MECSAKSRQNLTQVFYAAQRTVAFPISPLFDRASQSLTPEYVRILRRVFRFFDRDQDGLWSFAELNRFQKAVYLTELSRQEVVLLQSILVEQDSESVREEGLTEDGFCLLLKLFLQRDRTEANWVLLRSMHYDAHLQWTAPSLPSLSNPSLSPEWSFSVSLFLSRVLSSSLSPFSRQPRDSTRTTTAFSPLPTWLVSSLLSPTARLPGPSPTPRGRSPCPTFSPSGTFCSDSIPSSRSALSSSSAILKRPTPWSSGNAPRRRTAPSCGAAGMDRYSDPSLSGSSPANCFALPPFLWHSSRGGNELARSASSTRTNSRGTWKVGKRGNLKSSWDVSSGGHCFVCRVHRVDSHGETCSFGGNEE